MRVFSVRLRLDDARAYERTGAQSRAAKSGGAGVERERQRSWPKSHRAWRNRLAFVLFIDPDVEEEVYDLAVVYRMEGENYLVRYLDGDRSIVLNDATEIVDADAREDLDSGLVLQVLLMPLSLARGVCVERGRENDTMVSGSAHQFETHTPSRAPDIACGQEQAPDVRTPSQGFSLPSSASTRTCSRSSKPSAW